MKNTIVVPIVLYFYLGIPHHVYVVKIINNDTTDVYLSI